MCCFLASGSLIAPVFASILRSVEKRVSNLLVDLLTTGSLLSFHLPGLAHSILGAGAGTQHLFPPLQAWAGHFDGFAFPPSQVSVLLYFPAHHPSPPPTHPYFRGWGPGEKRNPPSHTSSQLATCSGGHQADRADPPASKVWGVGEPGHVACGYGSAWGSGAAPRTCRWGRIHRRHQEPSW